MQDHATGLSQRLALQRKHGLCMGLDLIGFGEGMVLCLCKHCHVVLFGDSILSMVHKLEETATYEFVA